VNYLHFCQCNPRMRALKPERLCLVLAVVHEVWDTHADANLVIGVEKAQLRAKRWGTMKIITSEMNS
jgi:hypothetical protein